MKRLTLALLASTGLTAAHAQAPSPAQMGVTQGPPQSLDVLDKTKTWVPVGTLTGGQFSVSGGPVYATTAGMAPASASGVPDNSPFVSALMNLLGPANPNSSSADAYFPAAIGQKYTEYYFSQPLDLTRAARFHCGSTTFLPSVYLVFAAGVDGVIQESKSNVPGSTGGGMLEGCTVFTMGFGVANANPLTPNTLTGVYFYDDYAVLIPKSTWSVGDGIILTANFNAFFPSSAIPAAPIGTTITAVDTTPTDGTVNLTLSNPVSQNLGPSGGSTPRATAIFTESGTNNFVANDTIQVGATTYKFVASIPSTTGTPNVVAIGADFPTSAANLISALNNTAGQWATYTPTTAGEQGYAPNIDVRATYAGGVITFTSVYGSPGANTLPSVYTPAGTAAGSFGGATFSGANTIASCTGACVATQNVDSRFYQLPAAQAFKIQTVAGSNSITVVSGPRLLRGGDIVWGADFPFGSTVFSSTGTTFPQTATMTIPTNTGGAQNALATHAPGAEANLWIVPTALKRRTAASADHNVFSNWPIGMSMACSAGNGYNCDLSRDHDNWHQGDLVGRWASGDNYSSSASYDEQFSDNHLTDYFGGGTLGEALYNPNFESGESSTARFPAIANCANQNATAIFGGYVGFGQSQNECSNQVSVYPPGPGSSITRYGPQSGATTGPTLSGFGRTGASSFIFKGGSDGTQCVSLGSAPNNWYMFGFGINNCATAGTWGIGYNNVTQAWELGLGGLTNVPFRFITSTFTGYKGIGTSIGFPQGLILAGDGNNNAGVNSRLLSMANFKPTGTWHLQGDTTVNTVAAPGGQALWYDTPLFSTTATQAFTTVAGSQTITVAACPPASTPAAAPIVDTSALISPSKPFGTYTSCTANVLTFTALTPVGFSSAAANDALKFMQWYVGAPISNDPANPDYTAVSIRSGAATNKDITGRQALTAGTYAYTLLETYLSAPTCFCADVTTPANTCTAAETTTTVTFTGTGTDTIKWQCIGRN